MRVLFSAAEIAARVDALAAEIARTLPPDFVIVGVLKGAWVFVADLARALDRTGARPEIEFSTPVWTHWSPQSEQRARAAIIVLETKSTRTHPGRSRPNE